MTKKIFLFFALPCFVLINAAVVFNEKDNTSLDDRNRSKREAITAAAIGLVLAGGVASAAAGYGFTLLNPPSESTCNIAISTTGSTTGRNTMKFNFVAIGDNCNANTEILGGKDTTFERVDGGRLQYITVRTSGKFCLEYLGIRCGNLVTGRGDKSIILSHESFPSYNCRMHKWRAFVPSDPECVWMSQDNENIRNFYINNDIFNCGENDYACHRNHIGNQIGGCVDKTSLKFNPNWCS